MILTQAKLVNGHLLHGLLVHLVIDGGEFIHEHEVCIGVVEAAQHVLLGECHPLLRDDAGTDILSQPLVWHSGH